MWLRCFTAAGVNHGLCARLLGGGNDSPTDNILQNKDIGVIFQVYLLDLPLWVYFSLQIFIISKR